MTKIHLFKAAGAADSAAQIATGTLPLTVTVAPGIYEVAAAELSNWQTVTVAGVAPGPVTVPSLDAASYAPADTITITKGTYTGTPMPTVTGSMTVGGVPVSLTDNGATCTATVPSEMTDGAAIVYGERASNGVDPEATQQANATVIAEATMVAVTNPGNGTLDVTSNADGDIEITVSGGTPYDGTYIASPALLDSGPVCLVPPVISGPGTVGQTLVKNLPGLWAYIGASIAVSQIWQADGSDIAGETGDSYTLTASEAGTTATLQEIATDSFGSRIQDSNGTAVSASYVFADDFGGAALGESLIGAEWEILYATGTNAGMEGDGAGSAVLTGDSVPSRVWVANTTAPAADQFAQAVYRGTTGGAAIHHYVGTRMSYVSGVRADGYYFNAQSGLSKVIKVVNGADTQIGTNGPAVADGDVMRIEVTGDGPVTIRTYIGGTLAHEVIDSTSPHLSGKVGLGSYITVAGGGIVFDDFEGEDL